MNSNKSICLFFGVVLFLSCNKGQNPDPDPTTTVVVPTVTPTIYVSGDTGYSYLTAPVYWKNGKLTSLPSRTNSYAKSIIFSGKDIFISAVYGGFSSVNTVAYWKNDLPINVAFDPTISSSTYPIGISISGNDKYVLGMSNDTTLLWKNNDISTRLVFSQYHQGSFSTDIAVSGNDVYITGQLYTSSKGSLATYWKNSTAVNLPSTLIPYTYAVSVANSVIVINGDTYITGTLYHNNQPYNVDNPGAAIYWKNGVEMPLVSNGHPSTANSITVSGTDVYVTGGIVMSNGLTEAVYWKNGIPTYLSNSTALSQLCMARCLVINGTDIYVAGNIGEFGATYWKNGVAVPLININGNEHGRAYSIAIGN